MGNEYMVRRNLLDAGCSDQSAAFVDQLVRTGRMTDALHEMKVITKSGPCPKKPSSTYPWKSPTGGNVQ